MTGHSQNTAAVATLIGGLILILVLTVIALEWFDAWRTSRRDQANIDAWQRQVEADATVARMRQTALDDEWDALAEACWPTPPPDEYVDTYRARLARDPRFTRR